MKKILIFVGFFLCAGGLAVTGTAWAKKNLNCKDADVVLSKKFPHFNFDADNLGCAHNDAGDCDPDSPVFFDDGNGFVYIDDDLYGEGLIIEGTNRKNTIHGSSGPDIICGRNGKDELWGEAGNDMIYGTMAQTRYMVDWAVIICTAATGRMIYPAMMILMMVPQDLRTVKMMTIFMAKTEMMS